jgi:hypothetical protein
MSVGTADYLAQSDELVPKGLLGMARWAVRHYGVLGTLGRLLLMRDGAQRFVRTGATPEDRAYRKELLQKFNLIHHKIACAHSPFQFVLMADYLLGLEVPGPIVECGCFKGGSSAKLSLLAKHTGRRLYVCDSFQGLPEPKLDGEQKLTGHSGLPSFALSAGEYQGGLDEVKENIARYGCIEVCEFIPGFFETSLAALDISPAMVFIDVDLVSSARDCFRHLWHRLAPGGYWFTHEAGMSDYIYGVFDCDFWRTELGECPPVILGAGSGLSVNSASLALIQKGGGKSGFESAGRASGPIV